MRKSNIYYVNLIKFDFFRAETEEDLEISLPVNCIFITFAPFYGQIKIFSINSWINN
jgi:hypothetical protein